MSEREYLNYAIEHNLFFADITEIQYFIEEIFYPPEEIQVEQPDFIDF